MAVKAVFFDVGETLIDETRLWESVADRLGVPRFTFLGVLGGLVARGEHHRRVFELLGIDPPEPTRELEADFYPDALPCLRTLRRSGYAIGLVGNTPEKAEAFLRACGAAVDVIGSSARWGVEKPAPEFFARISREAGCEPGEIVYVGDRVDNDVEPALAAGMIAVHIRRGPWGYLQPGREQAHICIDSLAELPDALNGV